MGRARAARRVERGSRPVRLPIDAPPQIAYCGCRWRLMADRIEREIEEILEKLDRETPGGALPADDKRPGSIMEKRKQVARQQSRQPRTAPRLPAISPATLLFVGAGTMIAGLVLSGFSSGLIWVAFVGVIIFLAAFAWSFMRSSTPGSPTGGGSTPPQGHYWRDRYIEYQPTEPGRWKRFTRRFRR